MLLIAGIVLVLSGIIGFILQLRYIQENQTENAKNN
jgi:preprotein translocase subunit Sss1